METPIRKSAAAVGDQREALPGKPEASLAIGRQLLDEPYRFDFFQAVRLLERLAWEASALTRRLPVGGDNLPSKELVRFRALASQSFPAAAIHRINLPGSQTEPYLPEAPSPEMVITFLGLTGPNGVLPRHYTTELLRRCRDDDQGMAEFFDLFNHRTASLFYRAWEKYRFPVAYERFRLTAAAGDDLFTACLYALTGIGSPALRRRMAVDDEAIVYYGGHFAHYPRSAVALEMLLADYFELHVEVRQFRGQWLRLSTSEQSRLPDAESPNGLNCALGENVIVGERVWDVEGLFRVVIGPLTYRQFSDLLPLGRAHRPLRDLTRFYVGIDLDFELQLLLLASEVPQCRLGGDKSDGSRLGWNSWLRSREFEHDASDAVFRIEPVFREYND
jgi:type VI secretion system protein ImpH